MMEEHNTDGSPLNDFRFIYKSPSDTWPSHLECIHCGNRVERGIVNVSTHWVTCLERKEGLIDVGNTNRDKIVEKS